MPEESSGRTRILVAEDSVTYRMVLKRILSKRYEVELAEDGMQAYNKFADFKPDLVITDLGMPNLDGIALIKMLKNVAPDVKILVLSGEGFTDRVKEAITAGALGFIVKSYDVDDVIAKVNNAVDKIERSQITDFVEEE